MPKPYSNCDIDNDISPPKFDSSLFNLIYHSKYEYSQDLCLGQCYLSENIKVCNCTDPTIEISVFDSHKCENVKETRCPLGRFSMLNILISVNPQKQAFSNLDTNNKKCKCSNRETRDFFSQLLNRLKRIVKTSFITGCLKRTKNAYSSRGSNKYR